MIKVFFEELQKTEDWVRDHRQEITELLSPVTQLEPAVLETIYDKTEWGVKPITEEIIERQQRVADKWLSLNLIPNKVDVRGGFLTPEAYADLLPKEVIDQQ